jgi:hypothetical protein
MLSRNFQLLLASLLSFIDVRHRLFTLYRWLVRRWAANKVAASQSAQ